MNIISKNPINPCIPYVTKASYIVEENEILSDMAVANSTEKNDLQQYVS